MSLINHVRVPTLKDMESGILETKHNVALFNAYLLSLIERAEFGDGLDRQQEFDRVNINKLIEKVSGLVLESDRLKLNLQKFNDICKEDSKQGERISKPIQEVGSPTQRDSAEMVTKRGKQTSKHPSSKTDSGISMDDRLSRPDSAASNQSLPPTAEACETDDYDKDPLDPRLSIRTENLLTTQAETASSRRVGRTHGQRETHKPTKKASTL
ncbi:uncharacterized protein LOC125669083 [Ostrea edulis]|uniref:uncharacterized protein LOC125669083 n=1 Tax=Ostrea edulis TaxID=37623 RepID=UPI0024AEA636|nr:uncharacterized protein LOC125669083 [Ostrea edulis]